MSESSEREAKRRARLRWITLGEAIAIAALVVSGLGLWKEWKSDDRPAGPTQVVEARKPIPLALRGRAQDEGRSLEITPVEDSHAIESLTITPEGSQSPIEVASDGVLRASDLEKALGDKAAEGKGTHRAAVAIMTRYVEAGADRNASGRYVISYRWEGGGLFGGRSLRITGLTRA